MSFRQVDITGKHATLRTATATGRIELQPKTISRIRQGKVEKGDPISLAKIMAIVAAKRTPELLALCHPLKIEATDIQASVDDGGIEVTVTVSAIEKTGVEMEALTAVSIALLNIWDMVKPYEKDAGGQYPSTAIQGIRVLRKAK